ncbi:hypothetical protein B0H13DRAFT_1879768 [Mycena leptocephala]|nr:hypothetical protein B0H13DRAFT_1879768 [Mycena leptocephala]
MAAPKTTTSKATRLTKSQGSWHLHKTKEELYKESELDWMNTSAVEVIKHLYAKRFTHDAETSIQTSDDLGMVLLRIAATADSVVVGDACRAVALLLGAWKQDDVLEDIAANVQKLLDASKESSLDPFEPVSTNASVVSDLRTAAEMLTHTVEEQCRDINTLTQQLEEDLTGIVERAKSAVPTPTAADTASAMQAATEAAPNTPRSYATAHVHPPYRAAALANAAARARQILIQPAPETERSL